MSRVIAGMTMSLDGFVCDAKGDLSALYPDLEQLRQTKMLKESIRQTGAALMGRRTYDLFPNGDLTEYEYQTPIFVVTHKPPAKAPKGQNANLSVHFVTEGTTSALQQAKRAAGKKDVTVVGGADILGQLLHAGLVDELQIGIVPIVLGRGLRFFENASDVKLKVESTRVLESPGRTDLFYRLSKSDSPRGTLRVGQKMAPMSTRG
jgi:dihydrofolate reductase